MEACCINYMKSKHPHNRSGEAHPFGITFLAVFVICAAAWNGLRLGEAIFFWKTFAGYGAYPLYILLSGGFWLIAGLLLLWGLWQGKTWGWLAAIGCAAGYTIWYWVDRLVLQQPHANWPFALVANIVLLLLFLIPLCLSNTRLFFQRDIYERKPQDPTSA